MSYNSSKGPRNIGDLINEDDPDTLLDWESNKIVFKTDSTKRFTIDNNEISGSGNAVIVGNTVLGGTLKVSGSTTLGDSSGDVLTINAATITLVNVPSATDNSVLVYDAANNTIATDEIDSKVWGGSLVDVTGTPSTNQVTTWSDADTVAGSANLTFDGTTLTTTGFSSTGNTTLGNAASDVVTLTGQVTASAEISGTIGRFAELRVSSLVGGSPISISASSITFTGSVDYGSTGSHGFYSGSAIHEFSATGSYTSGSGGSTEVSGGHIIISGSSPAITIHEGDLIVSGNTYLGDAVSDVVKIAAQLTASAGVLLNSTLDVGGNTTLGNADTDVTTLTGQVTASGGIRETSLNGILVTDDYAAVSSSIFRHSQGSKRMEFYSANGITMTGSVQAGNDLTVLGNTTLGNTQDDVITLTGRVTSSQGLLVTGMDGIVASYDYSFVSASEFRTQGSRRMSINASNGITMTGSVVAGNAFTVLGNTFLGNAAGDTLDITGRTTATGNISASLGITGSLLLATGSGAMVAVGVKSPDPNNMLYVSTIDNDNRVPLFVTNTTEQTILAATGSGHVLVGGKGAPVIDAKLNVSGSDLDQLLSCRSDSYAQVFHVSGSGNTFVSGNLGVGTASPEVKVDVNGNAIRIRSAGTPSSASDFGTQGEIRWDADYIYICVATDTWKRVAISTW